VITESWWVNKMWASPTQCVRAGRPAALKYNNGYPHRAHGIKQGIYTSNSSSL